MQLELTLALCSENTIKNRIAPSIAIGAMCFLASNLASQIIFGQPLANPYWQLGASVCAFSVSVLRVHSLIRRHLQDKPRPATKTWFAGLKPCDGTELQNTLLARISPWDTDLRLANKLLAPLSPLDREPLQREIIQFVEAHGRSGWLGTSFCPLTLCLEQIDANSPLWEPAITFILSEWNIGSQRIYDQLAPIFDPPKGQHFPDDAPIQGGPFSSLPRETLALICSRFDEPSDLLNLARSAKRFHHTIFVGLHQHRIWGSLANRRWGLSIGDHYTSEQFRAERMIQKYLNIADHIPPHTRLMTEWLLSLTQAAPKRLKLVFGDNIKAGSRCAALCRLDADPSAHAPRGRVVDGSPILFAIGPYNPQVQVLRLFLNE